MDVMSPSLFSFYSLRENIEDIISHGDRLYNSNKYINVLHLSPVWLHFIFNIILKCSCILNWELCTK